MFTYEVMEDVANGAGGWSEVPPHVREAVLLALERSPPREGRGAARLKRVARAVPPPPPYLTEETIERSIDTFEDALWVRAQGVRRLAQFHNAVETLQAAMGTHMSSLWRTSMQLRPDRLEEVRHSLGLRRHDCIPDGVPLSPQFARELVDQERILATLVEDLQRLRQTSVRFAAHYLSEEEKLNMGANPAYLRPEVNERSRQHRDTTATTRRRRAASTSAHLSDNDSNNKTHRRRSVTQEKQNAPRHAVSSGAPPEGSESAVSANELMWSESPQRAAKPGVCKPLFRGSHETLSSMTAAAATPRVTPARRPVPDAETSELTSTTGADPLIPEEYNTHVQFLKRLKAHNRRTLPH